MFSRPESIGLKPTPSESNGVTRPKSEIVPSVGANTPARARRSVDFPDPLCPTRPKTMPRGTSNEMPTNRVDLLTSCASTGGGASRIGCRPRADSVDV